MPTVLQLLAQRPSLTGSGVTIDALAREAVRARWDQHVVIAHPGAELPPAVDGLPDERVHVLAFETDELPFPVPGMSDVMPYRSTVFSSMSDDDWRRYRDAWRSHVGRVIDATQPDVIHSHHVWLLSSLVKELAPEIPLVVHCHATGLRQMRINPHRAPEVIEGCRRADAFIALHEDHADRIAAELGVPHERITVAGVGYRADVFHPRGRAAEAGSIVFAGKLAMSKGLPPLLDAFQQLLGRRPHARLHIAGGGSGDEGDALRERVLALAPNVLHHGRLDQSALAQLMRRSAVLVLPSFYEGLPLVLVEGRACGCRVVATALAGAQQLATALGEALELVDLPRLATVDQPAADDLPAFTRRLAAALERAIDAGWSSPDEAALAPFTWTAVFERIEAVWRGLLERPES